MGLENRDASWRFEPEQPSELEQLSEPTQQPASNPSPAPASLPSTLLSNMKPTPDAPGIPANSAPQYPSLDAAVETEQQVAPTLTNLLATEPQAVTQLNLGLEASSSKPTAEPAAESTTASETFAASATDDASQVIPEPKPMAEASDIDQGSENNAPSARDSEQAGSDDEAEKGDEATQGDELEPDFDQVDAKAAGDRNQQVLIKREDNHVAVLFPKEAVNANPEVALDFTDSQLWQDLQQRLSGGTAFAKDSPVHLYSQNHLLDTRQLQELDEALGRFNLKLIRIITSRRQTAVAAAMSGYSTDQTKDLPELLSKEVHSPQKIGLAEPLYLQKTIRSGTEIRHPGSVIIMGDLNPGSSVIADGDILVWGRLRGIAHAGAAGHKTSIVMALKLEAPQLRIAGAVARVAAQDKAALSPEIAYISDKGIRITSAHSFNRSELG